MSDQVKGVSKRDRIIGQAKKVIEEYTTRLTVRQIYYRLVSVHTIENKVSEYQAVVKALTWGRLNGEIDYARIEDRMRAFIGNDHDLDTPENHFDAAKQYFNTSWKYFNLPFWLNQSEYVEVWLEKQALAALFEQVTAKWFVRLAPCRGYPSLTFLWEGAEYLKKIADRNIQILYFGDFDPSGLDIPRYIEERLTNDLGVDVGNMSFTKVAITQDQIDKYNIPPMPAKTTDARSAKFIEEHGELSAVELDAIDPNVLQELIEKAIKEHYDEPVGDEREEEQEAGREKIKVLIQRSLRARGTK